MVVVLVQLVVAILLAAGTIVAAQGNAGGYRSYGLRLFDLVAAMLGCWCAEPVRWLLGCYGHRSRRSGHQQGYLLHNGYKVWWASEQLHQQQLVQLVGCHIQYKIVHLLGFLRYSVSSGLYSSFYPLLPIETHIIWF